jgi:hypothetical protein
MPELILSDITVMRDGLCIIGLEKVSADSFRSVRPLPPGGYAWRTASRVRRGERVLCQLQPLEGTKPPHLEDSQSQGLARTGTPVSQQDLVASLQLAETASGLNGLFGCDLSLTSHGGNAWVHPEEANRSICGALYRNIWFQIYAEERLTLRARLIMPSNERLNSLPVVDREWRGILDRVVDRVGRDDIKKAENYFNRSLRWRLLKSAIAYARIGLARPSNGKCWLMLDSLFPQPEDSWLDSLG